MINTILVPVVKSKSGDLSDRNNYRPIALASVVSKVFELMLLNRCERFLHSADNQFGFKSGLSTELCICTLKEVINHYQSRSRHVLLCFMVASKAFDMVNHWTLFKVLIDKGVPLIIVRIQLVFVGERMFLILLILKMV